MRSSENMKKLFEDIKKLFEREAVRYVVAGGLTTAVNYVIYLALEMVHVHYLAANCLAWVGAVVFAFFINREMVFHSEDSGITAFLQFGSARLVTLGLETLLLALLVQWAGIPAFFAKIVVSVVTVVLNYVICKFGIFREKNDEKDERTANVAKTARVAVGGISHEGR